MNLDVLLSLDSVLVAYKIIISGKTVTPNTATEHLYLTGKYYLF